MRPAPVHRLRPNESEWTPPHVVYADTEALAVPGAAVETLRVHLWVARLVDRRPTDAGRQETITRDGDTPAQLAAAIDAFTAGRRNLWIYFHNANFDLAATRLPVHLGRLGWQVTDAALSAKAPWVRLAKGSKRLVIADSYSWLPSALEVIGLEVHAHKPPLPSEDDNRAAWLARCTADVDILAAGMGQLMDWWDREQLGHWSITGSQCGWNAYRHRPGTPGHWSQGGASQTVKVGGRAHHRGWQVIIDPDPDTQDADRAATYGGRRQSWRHGPQRVGHYAEIDFHAAHATVAATLPLPWRRGGRYDRLPVDDPRIDSDRRGILARVLIDTDRPDYPVQHGGRVVYPVGRFWTTLAGPDITAARDAGHLVAIGPAQVHELGYEMADWARWVLHCTAPGNTDTPPVARRAMKQWGRSVVGKWAQHGFTKIKIGLTDPGVWDYREGWDADQHAPGGEVHMGGSVWWWSAAGQSDNAYPAILAWVEAYERRALARLIALAGPGALLVANTDGVIIDADRIGRPVARGGYLATTDTTSGARLGGFVRAVNAACEPLTARVKDEHRTARVLGPVHHVMDGFGSFSGIRYHGDVPADSTVTVQQWPKLTYQMGRGSAAGYVRPEHTARIAGSYASGWVCNDGTVRPVAIATGDDQANRLLVPGEPGAGVTARQLAAVQPAWLLPYLPAGHTAGRR